MELLRVGAATLNQTPLDWEGNFKRIVAILDQAKAAGVELLCLPELCLTGYGCEDAFFSLATARKAEEMLGRLLPHTTGLTVIVGLPLFFHGAMYNTAVMVQSGNILGINPKRVLPREGVHYEPRWFRPWSFNKVAATELCGKTVPLGDIRYRLGSLGVAIEICEEAWDSIPASAAHADAVDVVMNPSASHFAMGKFRRRERLIADSSRALGVHYVYANLVGCEAGRIVYDGGVLIAEGGDIAVRGRRFGFSDGELTYRDVNIELARLAKLRGKPVRGEHAGLRSPDSALDVVEIKGGDPRHRSIPKGVPPKRVTAPAAAPTKELTANEEFLQAEMLGLFDYMRKSRAKGYVVSLSGGCDSGAAAVLVAHMLAEALKELGPEALQARLHLEKKVDARAPKELIKRLLTCVYQKTENSSKTTEQAAADLAHELGALFYSVDVQPMVDVYRQAGESLLGRELAWSSDDLALQNIQARARSPMVWLLANVKGAILLSTSNRSEAAVGYATMDGDTSGGLAPLAGIDKAFLRLWLKWAENQTEVGLGALPSLAAINKLPPTAELRPADKGQQDEADLMPYEVLERIERYFVRDRLGARDILEMLRDDFSELDVKVLHQYVTKFFKLWGASQWKRERLAPAFHLDDESLDPKTWCRFPILSGTIEIE